MRRRPHAAIAASLAAALVAASARAGTPSAPGEFPKLAKPDRLEVASAAAFGDAEIVMIEGLQGIVAQTRPEIFVDHDASTRTWLDDAGARHATAISRAHENDPWWFVGAFRARLDDSGFVVYDTEASRNVAATVAGLKRWLPIHASLVANAQKAGLKQKLDVRGKDEVWAWRTFGRDPALNRDVVFHHHLARSLYDYAIATRGFVFHADIAHRCFRDEVFASLPPLAHVFGTWDQSLMKYASHGIDPSGLEEIEFVSTASEHSLITLPADYARNLSVLAGYRDSMPILTQPTHARPRVEHGVHYVSFVMSDGDNVGWTLNDFVANPKWFASSRRGRFDMGWTISPALAEIAPSAMQYLYDRAVPGRDQFVAGPSGPGYLYPSRFAKLSRAMNLLGHEMVRADLNVVTLLDRDLFSIGGAFLGFTVPNPFTPFRTSKLEAYAREPQVAGGLAVNVYGYEAWRGKIVWAGGKPFLSARYRLGLALAPQPAQLAAEINRQPKNPRSASGYSLVYVVPWGATLDDVAAVVDRLDPNVRVVTPEALVKLVAANVPHR